MTRRNSPRAKRACRHPLSKVTIYENEATYCWRCESWLSLGPSNDGLGCVEIELHALDIASRGRGDSIHAQDGYDDRESCGPHCAGWEWWLAGYLASFIATHTD